MRTAVGCTLLSIALLAGCACPPVSSSSSNRGRGSDPSGGTFAFLGGLRCFFGDDSSATTKDETRPATPADLADKGKPAETETDHAAALTIR